MVSGEADPTGRAQDSAKDRVTGVQVAPRPAHRSGRVISIALSVGAFLALIGWWQYLGATGGGYFVPTFTDTAVAFWRQLGERAMWDPLLESNVALAIGFPASVVAGGALGLVLGRASIVDRLLGIYVDMALVVPIIAVVPIIIVAFGITLTSKVVVVVLFALPVVALSVRSAVRDIDRDRVEMARAFGATARHIWPKVILPAALPAVFSGLRVGLSRAISGMIVVELTLVPTGIGGLFVKYRSRFDAPNLYAVTLVVLAEGIILAWLMRRCETLLPREASHG